MSLVAGGVGLVVFGIIILSAGFFMNSYTQDNVSQCGEWYGQLGQMLDPKTSQSCQNVSMMQAASQSWYDRRKYSSNNWDCLLGNRIITSKK